MRWWARAAGAAALALLAVAACSSDGGRDEVGYVTTPRAQEGSNPERLQLPAPDYTLAAHAGGGVTGPSSGGPSTNEEGHAVVVVDDVLSVGLPDDRYVEARPGADVALLRAWAELAALWAAGLDRGIQDGDGEVVAAATVRVREYGGTLTEDEMRAVLTVAGWPAPLHEEALTVSWGESRWSPYAHNESDVGLGSFGLFQLNTADFRNGNVLGWATYCGVGVEDLYDPLTNAACAWAAYQRSGWGPWSVKP